MDGRTGGGADTRRRKCRTSADKAEEVGAASRARWVLIRALKQPKAFVRMLERLQQKVYQSTTGEGEEGGRQ